MDQRQDRNGNINWLNVMVIHRKENPKQNSYLCTINLNQDLSLSLLSHKKYRQRRKKRDKMNKYIETMKKRLTNNTSKKQIHHNKPKLAIPQNKDQSVSEPTSDKSPAMIKQNKSQQPNHNLKRSRTQKTKNIH